jgi:hypothetical protein
LADLPGSGPPAPERQRDTALNKRHDYIPDCSTGVRVVVKRNGAPPPAAATPLNHVLP